MSLCFKVIDDLESDEETFDKRNQLIVHQQEEDSSSTEFEFETIKRIKSNKPNLKVKKSQIVINVTFNALLSHFFYPEKN